MAKRLVLGSVVVAGLGVVSTWSQAPVAAFWAQPPVAEQAPPPAKKEANKGPQYGPKLEGETALVEEDVFEKGVTRTVLRAVDAKALRERYVWHHQQIAEKLTVEQLAEKCNALKRESIGLSPEGAMDEMQNQLDQLKRKYHVDKGISTRIQAAIEALKRQPVGESKSPAQPPAKKAANNVPQYRPVVPEETGWLEEDVRDNGVIRTVMMAADAKTLRERYVWHHQQIAEKLTVEQLAEKCNALKRESIGSSPEGELEQMQKELDQLKRKHHNDKGISARIQNAIEALKKQPAAESTAP